MVLNTKILFYFILAVTSFDLGGSEIKKKQIWFSVNAGVNLKFINNGFKDAHWLKFLIIFNNLINQNFNIINYNIIRNHLNSFVIFLSKFQDQNRRNFKAIFIWKLRPDLLTLPTTFYDVSVLGNCFSKARKKNKFDLVSTHGLI